MRLTRGCRAGGGVACSSLEYGGIRAATSRTPAPRAPLSLSLSLLATSPNALPHPFYSSSSPLLAVSLGNVASALPFPPIPPLVLVHLELSLSLSFSISIRHRAVRSLPSRAYDAPSPPPPSPSTLATMTRRRERCRSSRLFFLADHTRRFFSFGLKPTREGRWVVVVVVEMVERKRIRLVERAVQKAR